MPFPLSLTWHQKSRGCICNILEIYHLFLILSPLVRAAPRATGSKDSAPPSPDRKQNGRVASSTNGTSSAKKASAGSTSGSVTGEKGLSDKSRDRRRGADRKDGDRKEGERSTRGAEGERRDRGGRERTPNSKVRTDGVTLIEYRLTFCLSLFLIYSKNLNYSFKGQTLILLY